MTREEKDELNALLDKAGMTGKEYASDRNWIFKALDMTSYKVDAKGVNADFKELSFLDMLQLVAYGVKGLPLAFRKKKYCSEQFDDPEFFSLEDDEWEKFRLRPDRGLPPKFRKYIIPDE